MSNVASWAVAIGDDDALGTILLLEEDGTVLHFATHEEALNWSFENRHYLEGDQYFKVFLKIGDEDE